jgi:FKBP-type peptidyl-prolyl cis-trans isomerase 2
MDYHPTGDSERCTIPLGCGGVIPGLERGVIGMRAREIKTITAAPEEAYGPTHGELLLDVEKSEFPENSTGYCEENYEGRRKLRCDACPDDCNCP